MSLSDLLTDPILIVSFDRIDVEQEETNNTESGKKADPKDAEIIAKQDIIDRFLTSDSYLKRIRIPILITDALQTQVVGTNSSTGKTVTYVLNEPKLSNNNNSVSVELTLKNNIGDLSVISDILTAIFTRMFNDYQTSARASFFGHNLCIFNGFITGVNRATVSSTNQERLNLTFERAENNPREKEKPEVPKTPADNVLPNPNNPNPTDPAVLSDVSTQAANDNAGGSAAGRLFYWYDLGTIETYTNAPVPEIEGTETVNRLDFVVYHAKSYDFAGVIREAITLFYDDVYLPLNLNNHSPYYKQNAAGQGYAVTSQYGHLWLGVESVL